MHEVVCLAMIRIKPYDIALRIIDSLKMDKVYTFKALERLGTYCHFINIKTDINAKLVVKIGNDYVEWYNKIYADTPLEIEGYRIEEIKVYPLTDGNIDLFVAGYKYEE